MNCTACLSIVLLSLAMATAKDSQLKAVLQGNAEFTRNLYQAVSSSQGNIFFSPISIHAALSMVYQGAKGSTKDAFSKTLNISSQADTAEGYMQVMKSLNSVKDVTLLIANKIFVKHSYALLDSFSSTVKKSFLSEVQQVDFEKSQEAVKTINTWVEDKTNKKIKDLIKDGDVDGDTRLVLVNAIYFKGMWFHPFPKADTKTEKFYLNDKDAIDVQMMHLHKGLYYKEDENLDAKVLELPYSNKDLSMIIILPNKRNGIADLEKKLATIDLSAITENMYKPDVQLALPKFKIETEMQLGETLTKMGLGVIFSDQADLSGMLNSTEPLKVSKVIHKAYIEVTEEGTEAAAATGVHIKMRTGRLNDPIEFVADHPFIAMLGRRKGKRRHRLTNPVFFGRVSYPLQKL